MNTYIYCTKYLCPADLVVWLMQNELKVSKISNRGYLKLYWGAKKEDKPKLFMSTFSLISDI